MLYNLRDFDNPIHLQPYISFLDDITLVDGFVIFLDGIGKIWFDFKGNRQTDRIFRSGI